MPLVCDASPLIVLAKAEFLALLPGLAEAVEVPRAVASEILAGPPDVASRRIHTECAWLRSNCSSQPFRIPGAPPAACPGV